MTNNDPSRRPEPIPLSYANILANVTKAHLDELAAATSQMLANGRPASEVIQSLVQAGWDQGFTRWFVGVFASGGRVETTPPVINRPSPVTGQASPTLPIQPVQDVGNFWDKQAAAYKEGSIVLWVHVICCVPGLIIAPLLMIGCRTEEGKENGGRLLKYSAAGIGVYILLRVIAGLVGSAGRMLR